MCAWGCNMWHSWQKPRIAWHFPQAEGLRLPEPSASSARPRRKHWLQTENTRAWLLGRLTEHCIKACPCPPGSGKAGLLSRILASAWPQLGDKGFLGPMLSLLEPHSPSTRGVSVGLRLGSNSWSLGALWANSCGSDRRPLCGGRGHSIQEKGALS